MKTATKLDNIIYKETTIKQQIKQNSALFGLIRWNTVINTQKIKDDLVIWIPSGMIDKIWLYEGDSQKVELGMISANKQ